MTKLGDKDDMFKLVLKVNNASKKPIDRARLSKSFDLAWPNFNRDVSEALSKPLGAAPVPRTIDDKVDEILALVRAQNRSVTEVSAQLRHPARSNNRRDYTSAQVDQFIAHLFQRDGSMAVARVLDRLAVLDREPDSDAEPRADEFEVDMDPDALAAYEADEARAEALAEAQSEMGADEDEAARAEAEEDSDRVRRMDEEDR
jgi:hypothetical protein